MAGCLMQQRATTDASSTNQGRECRQSVCVRPVVVCVHIKQSHPIVACVAIDCAVAAVQKVLQHTQLAFSVGTATAGAVQHE
jgi:hypothetical protein